MVLLVGSRRVGDVDCVCVDVKERAVLTVGWALCTVIAQATALQWDDCFEFAGR